VLELLGLHRVIGEMLPRDGLVLLVEHDGDVGFVGQRGRPTKMVKAAMAEPLPPREVAVKDLVEGSAKWTR
jgi:hypothetical protein